eukprot:1176804-Prorocentrum_minimum.AAC.1
MLSKSDFVTELGESTALRLLAAAVYTKCGAGKVLIRQGDQGIIRGLSGSIRVIKVYQGPPTGSAERRDAGASRRPRRLPQDAGAPLVSTQAPLVSTQ